VVHALEAMPDHVHLFVETDPANTSRVLREEFRRLRTTLPTLWSRSYFCALTVGTVSETTVRRSIEAQKGRGR
jgi:putative transposase